ncbi:MAG: prolyl oligopeptidase family serine peptidase [Niabella sp.]
MVAGYTFAQTAHQETVEVKGKPPIDFAALENWAWSPAGISISDDGHFFCYKIRSNSNVQSTDSIWSYDCGSIQSGVFSDDSRWYIYLLKDSLFFLPLGDGPRQFAGLVEDYKTSKRLVLDKVSWLAYKLKDSSGTLMLCHFQSNRKEKISGVKSYDFDGGGRWLLCRLNDGELLLYSLTSHHRYRLPYITQYTMDKAGKYLSYIAQVNGKQLVKKLDLSSGKETLVWESINPAVTSSSLTMDEAGHQLLFTLQQKSHAGGATTIWYWRPGMVKAEERVNNPYPGIAEGLIIDGPPSFTDNARYINFNLRPLPAAGAATSSEAAAVDIWHYQDTLIQSAQLLYSTKKMLIKKRWMEPPVYTAIVSVDGNTPIYVDDNYKRLSLIKGDYAIVRRDGMTDPDMKEQYSSKDSVWLVSLRDGRQQFLKLEYVHNPISLSPDGRYLVWFDTDKGHYFTYDLKAHKQVNISASTLVYLGSNRTFDVELKPDNRNTGILGWLPQDEWLLVYDDYDIWQLDPAGRKSPVNITNGYGRRNGLQLRLTEGEGNNELRNGAIAAKANLMLTALNTRTMENGFYRKSLNREGDPEKLFMDNCVVDWSGVSVNNGNVPASVMPPVKARNTSVWVVRRQTATEAPNYFITRDLKNYKALTDIQPQKNYKWLTAELVRFKQMDGTMSQGILYKPEKFDSTKRYPVIINYYFQFSHLLNKYPVPDYANSAHIEIPWFVSRDYLVFVPDIYFTTDRPRPASAWNTVEGAGRYLSKLTYVDSTKIGISGHSRAGGYTNYIITHSNRFAAALSGAGVSDWVSAQLQLIRNSGNPRPDNGQEPSIYAQRQFIMQNPILHADKITTPLLIFHNRDDSAVPWEQSVELYIAMRRLGKKVWMLQYDGQTHTLSQKKAQVDLTLRITQFFDHYLKGAPPPKWMTTGIPARLKGIETGLELDNSRHKL